MVMTDAVSASTSPYTGTQQVQWWPGGDFWTATINLPQMVRSDKAAWGGFLGELRGMKNVFWLGHPQKRIPQGAAKGIPVVNGTNAAMATTLNTKGWTPGIFAQLQTEDHIQIGTYLHVVLGQVDSDANGLATISIWPSLRVAVGDSTPIILVNPSGLFRLADNSRSLTTTETQLTAVKPLKCMEAR